MGPQGWVFDYDAYFQLIFALITLAIGYFSMKIYSFSKQRQLRNFGLSFISISLSFFALTLLNFGVIDLITQMVMLEQEGLMRLFLTGYMALYILGVITLAYMTLKLKSNTTYYMLLIITFVSIIAATHKLYLFYSIASVLFGYVFIYYLRNYKKQKKLRNLLVMTGFGFLFIANVSLIFSVQTPLFYILGHILEFIGYCLLLVNLLRVIK